MLCFILYVTGVLLKFWWLNGIDDCNNFCIFSQVAAGVASMIDLWPLVWICVGGSDKWNVLWLTLSPCYSLNNSLKLTCHRGLYSHAKGASIYMCYLSLLLFVFVRETRCKGLCTHNHTLCVWHFSYIPWSCEYSTFTGFYPRASSWVV